MAPPPRPTCQPKGRQVCCFPPFLPLPTAGPRPSPRLLPARLWKLLSYFCSCCWPAPSSCTLPLHPECSQEEMIEIIFNPQRDALRGRSPNGNSGREHWLRACKWPCICSSSSRASRPDTKRRVSMSCRAQKPSPASFLRLLKAPCSRKSRRMPGGKRGEPSPRPGGDWLHVHGPRTNSQVPDLQLQGSCVSWDGNRLGTQSLHRDPETLPRELWPCLSLLSSKMTNPCRCSPSPLSREMSQRGCQVSWDGLCCPGLRIPQAPCPSKSAPVRTIQLFVTSLRLKAQHVGSWWVT